MLIFSAFIFLTIVFLLRLAAFVLILPIAAAAAAIIAVNVIGKRCCMGLAPLLWDAITVITSFKAVMLLSSDIFLGSAITVDLCRLLICYILCSVVLLIWWIARETFFSKSKQQASV